MSSCVSWGLGKVIYRPDIGGGVSALHLKKVSACACAMTMIKCNT